MGCDFISNKPELPCILVSIHAPAWGATTVLSYSPSSSLFQSTHPRGVRLREHIRQIHRHEVSIHAPAWGATGRPGYPDSPAGVSIHAPAWGATRTASRIGPQLRGFNPRTRVGCDAQIIPYLPLAQIVSIHAPAWGATRVLFALQALGRGFNPRTRVGCDHLYWWLSTCPIGFNPRTRVGCDLSSDVTFNRYLDVSIHAPAWGATSKARMPVSSGPFQSTHPRGVRHLGGYNGSYFGCFNPRTRVGCDSGS